MTTAAGMAASVAARKAIAAPPKEWRLLEGATGKQLRLGDLPGRLAAANAIFLGELHDDPETHRAESWIFEEVSRKVGERLTLAMEMFERDGQKSLDDYLAGKIDEAALGKQYRLWPNYATDYRAMVEYAKANRIPVLASNAPQRLVRQVGKEGLASLKNLPDADRPLIASYVNAPEGDAYADRFAKVMGQGHGEEQMPPDRLRRIYEAQCLRDDTMAETVGRAIDAGRTVVHVNGSFHSDAGLGTAARVLWRRPLGTRLAIVKIVPFKGEIAFEPLKGEADFLLFVPDTRPEKPAR